MAAAPLPVTVVLANTVVGHLADTVLSVGRPIALVLVARFVVTVRAAAVTASIKEVSLEDVTIVIGGRSESGKAPRARLKLVVLSSKLIFAFFSSL